MAVKILIIEDDPLLVKLYKECLQSIKVDIEIATDGKSGLDKINSENYGLVILDVMLPVMDGLTVLKEMKNGSKSNPPVLVMTNLTGGAIEKEAINEGYKHEDINIENNTFVIEGNLRC